MRMQERIQQNRTDTDSTADQTLEDTAVVSHDKLKSDLDDLLDEIDEALETNAEEFVKNYVQKGGE
jgi:prokaryotic ubiquitin-like protein Pup